MAKSFLKPQPLDEAACRQAVLHLHGAMLFLGGQMRTLENDQSISDGYPQETTHEGMLVHEPIQKMFSMGYKSEAVYYLC